MGSKVFTGVEEGRKRARKRKEAGVSSQDMRDSSPALAGGSP